MDTVSLLSEISILKRYIEWLETSLASYEPDWICDKMGDKDLCHDWCYANCGTEAWTHDCFKKYYDNFVADRKTEPTSSKMEQVDKDINVRSKTEPQTSCKTCRYGEVDEGYVRCAYYSKATEQDEPQTERSE